MARYSELNPQLLLDTIEKLERRIEERFPHSALRQVSHELRDLAGEISESVPLLGRPMWPLRIGTALLVAAIGYVLVRIAAGSLAPLSANVAGISDLLQGLEAAVNVIILLVLGIVFLVSLELRLKRHRTLASLHRVRSFVHIVDMHQLTKDPEQLLTPDMATAVSPLRELDRFELARYLSYCSELLSLASKLAVLHAQYLQDSVVLDAGNDLETLVASLSNKIWQKITILDLAVTTPIRALSASQDAPVGA